MRRRPVRGDCEIGVSVHSYEDEVRRRKATVRRRRTRTLCVAALCVCACVMHMALRHLQASAAAAAVAAKEPCAPLFGSRLAAVVLVDLGSGKAADEAAAVSTARVLWWPSYNRTAAETATELIRTKESSGLCPTTVSRIRPKQLAVKTVLRGGSRMLHGKQAVCVAHLIDYFEKRTCFY